MGIFKKYGNEEIKESIASIAKGTINDILSQYSGIQLLSERGTIALSIQKGLEDALNNENIAVTSLQLFDTVLPEKFKKILIETEKKSLEIQIAKNRQQGILNELELAKKKALTTQLNIRNKAELDSFKMMDICQATNESKKAKLSLLSTSLANIKTSLGFSNQELISYLYTLESHLESQVNIQIPKYLNCYSDSSPAMCK